MRKKKTGILFICLTTLILLAFLTGTSGTLTAADGENYQVSVHYDAAARIPAGASLKVTELSGGDVQDYYDRAAAEVGRFDAMRLFDIRCLAPDGTEIEPAAPVKVTVRLPGSGGTAQYSRVLHFTGGQVDVLAHETAAHGGAVQFETDGFSVYALVGYTVDFHWGDETYQLAGGSGILLSDLLNSFTEDGGTLRGTSEIEAVTFSNPELVRVERTGNDWFLTSLAAFDTQETLTLTLTDGKTIEIPVTDARVEGTLQSGRRVTADGVTYTLSNSGTANGYAEVYAISAGCTIHDEISYKNHVYQVREIDQTVGKLTQNKTKMDWELVKRIAVDKEITLPDIKTEPDANQLAAVQGFTAGSANGTAKQKVWKKAEFNDNTVTYTLKYFQAMNKDVPIDFIFVYDDSDSMYSGTRISNHVRLREAQTTRIMILDAVHALLSDKSGYNFKVYLAGASTGDDRISGALESYTEVEDYLSYYHKGVTRHAIGIKNASTLATDSKNAGRNPVIVYLSDFHQASTLGTAGINTTNTLRSQKIPVYGLSTDLSPTGNAARYIPTDSSYLRTMRELTDGIEALQDIIWEAIGYYMTDNVTITDTLSDPLKGQTPANTIASGNGTVKTQTGKTDWSVGRQSPLLRAGELYTETFTVALNQDKVYSGSMPTNATVSVKLGNTETNSIAAEDSPIVGKGVDFVLGKMNKDGTQSDVKLGGVKFTLQKDGESITKEYTTDANGAFTVPFSDCAFKPGEKYTLTQDQSTTPGDVSITNSMTWTLTVNADYTITAVKDGADTDVTIANGKFNLWNKEFTLPPLKQIFVKKTWNVSDDDLKQAINFTVYGVKADNSEVPLTAYAANDDNTESGRKANTVVTQLKQTDKVDSTEFMREVWVPQYIENDGIVSYTIKEAPLTNPEDDPDDDVIGEKGEWKPSQSKTENIAISIIVTPGSDAGWVDGKVHDTRTYLTVSFKQDVTVSNLVVYYQYNSTRYSENIQFEQNIKFLKNIEYKIIYGSQIYYKNTNIVVTVNEGLSNNFSMSSYIKSATKNNTSSGSLPHDEYTYSVTNENVDVYIWKEKVDPEYNTANTYILTLTNTFNNYKTLTINSVFTDTSSDRDTTKTINYVGYSVTNSAGAVVATPKAEVTTTSGNTKSADVKFYVPTGDTYTAKQTYYQLSDGTIVNADEGGSFHAFTVTPSGTNCTQSGSTGSVGDTGGTITFTNDRKMFPVTVKATWEPALGSSAADNNVKTNGITYEIKWGENKQSGNVKENNSWTENYTDIPTYTIKGEETTCAIDATDDPHPNYETVVERAISGNNLQFTIVNTIKKSEITIGKEWELDSNFSNLRPDSVTVQVQNSSGTVMSFAIPKVDGEGNVTTDTVSDLVLNNGNGWKIRVQVDVGQNYTVTETKIGNDNTSASKFNASYTVTTYAEDGDNKVTEDTSSPATDVASIAYLNTYGAVVNITNSFTPIARVSNDNGSTWTYYEYLLTTDSKPGAFDDAKGLTGDVVIETLLEEHERYTLTRGTTFDKAANITLRTTPDETWNPDGFTSTIVRGFNGSSTGSTALFYVDNANAKLRTADITLDGAYNTDAKHTGRAVYVNNGTLTINGGSTFRNFSTNGNGGAIYVSNSLTVTGTADSNVVFENCVSTKEHGGAIYQSGGDSLTMSYVTFGKANTPDFGCTTALEGGCVYSKGSVATLTDCDFYYGIAGEADKSNKARGGAIYYNGATRLSIYGCVFDHCSAKTTSTEVGWGNGGAIFVDSNVVLTIDESSERQSSFTDCFGRRFGGAVMYEPNGGQSVSISNTTFTECYTEIRGGGAVCTDSNSTIIDKCTFKKCYDKSDSGGEYSGGGAIQLNPDGSVGSNPNCSISDSTFEDCYTKVGNGGAIYSHNGSVPVTLTNVNIDGHTTGNTTSLAASTANAKSGGAVYCKGDLTVKKTDPETSEIKNCSASENGGAVYACKNLTVSGTSDSTVKFWDCSATASSASTGNGGAIYTADNYTIKISNADFEDCFVIRYNNTNTTINTGRGGAMYFTNGTISLTDVEVDGVADGHNLAKGVDAWQGGGIYLANGNLTLTHTILHDCHVSGVNTATNNTSHGGGVYVNAGTLTVQGKTVNGTNYPSEFKECAAPNGNGGAIYNKGTTVSIANTMIDGHFKHPHTPATLPSEEPDPAQVTPIPSGDNEGLIIGVEDDPENVDLLPSHGIIPGDTHLEDDVPNAKYGGAVYMNAGALSITGTDAEPVSIKNCTVTMNGGAIYKTNTGTVTLNNVTIDGHDQERPGDTAETFDPLPAAIVNAQNGGAIFMAGGTLNITGGEIRNFRTHFNGGAIYNNTTVTNTATVLIDGTTIKGFNGTAADRSTLANAQSGGAIYNNKGKLNIRNAEILDCKASQFGGAIYENNASNAGNTSAEYTVRLENVKIDGHAGGLANDQTNAQYGGAIYTGSTGDVNKGGSVWMDNCRLLDCMVSERGGAIFSQSTWRRAAEDQPTVYMRDTIIDGHETLDENVSNAQRGGAILLGNGTLVIKGTNEGDAEIRNCTATQFGGGIDSYGDGTQFKNVSGFTPWSENDYTIRLENATIADCKALGDGTDKSGIGGGINIKSILTMRDSRIVGCHAARFGGAISSYASLNGTVTSWTVINMNDPAHPNTITGNTAGEKGAGIYLLPTEIKNNRDARLKLAGSQNFGGKGVDANGVPIDGNKITIKRKIDTSGKASDTAREVEVVAGNFITSTLSNKTNGFKAYTKERQDIYIAEFLGTSSYTPATSLHVTGAIPNTITNDVGDNDGTIWVMAEVPATENENNHYQQLKQFAVFTSDLAEADKASTIRVFRNAVDDERTQNGTDSYLTGSLEGDLSQPGSGSGSPYQGYIYWTGSSGSSMVILRKVSKATDTDTYTALSDAKFTIYKGNSGTAYVVKDKNGISVPLENRTSNPSGIFWAGRLPYGTYYLKETEAPDGYRGNQDKWFCLIVNETGTYMSGGFKESGGDAASKAKALEDAEKLLPPQQTNNP